MAGAKKKLGRVQRLACLGIMGAIHSTPTGAVEVLIGPTAQVGPPIQCGS